MGSFGQGASELIHPVISQSARSEGAGRSSLITSGVICENLGAAKRPCAGQETGFSDEARFRGGGRKDGVSRSRVDGYEVFVAEILEDSLGGEPVAGLVPMAQTEVVTEAVHEAAGGAVVIEEVGHQ